MWDHQDFPTPPWPQITITSFLDYKVSLLFFNIYADNCILLAYNLYVDF